MNDVVVSVIIPCFKQGKYLSDALDSVIAQTFTKWECVIINDGSPDNTEKIAKSYCKKDKRFTYIYQNNSGVSTARNFAIQKSRGRYILPLDADDKIGPQLLGDAVGILDNNSNIKIVYCLAEFFGQKEGLWNLPPYSFELLLARNMIFNTSFFRRTDFDRVGGYCTDMRTGYEDWELWISILEKGGDVYCINKVLFFYRSIQKSRTKSARKRITDFHKMRIVMIQRHLEAFKQSIGSIVYDYNDLVQSIDNSSYYKFGYYVLRIPRCCYLILKTMVQKYLRF